jgi:myo-inositol-1(or 4)-monophosphatase
MRAGEGDDRREFNATRRGRAPKPGQETDAMTIPELKAICEHARSLVRSAGAIVAHHYERLDPRRVYDKGFNDLVTPADHEVEAFLRECLASEFPEFGFIGEETGVSVAFSGYSWVADPIDGTTNFAHGFPYFCVSLALYDGEKTVLGVIYDPLRDEMYSAVRGGGAHRDGQAAAVPPRDTLVSALIASGFPNRALAVLPRYENIHRRCLRAGAGIRRTGSAALDLAHIAAGRIDGTFQFGISLWDYAAGALLVTEAGGKVVTSPDAESIPAQTHIFAGSDFVVNQLLSFDESPADATAVPPDA